MEEKMTEQQLYCSACGKQIDKKIEVCPHCGRKMVFRFLKYFEYSNILSLIQRLFGKVFVAILWLNVISFTIAGIIVGASIAELWFGVGFIGFLLGLPIGFLLGALISIISGGLVATLLKIADTQQKIYDAIQSQNNN